MAITPYSTPTQYQYKPLNLMAFAEPLMKMQEKYDLTKAALEESDVKATALQYAEDPIKARELEKTYRTKRDELVANLMETKNYTQAASKLKQLNKLYQQDPERIALETNYKTFLERDKEELARVGVGEGKITKKQYLQWRAGEIRKFEDAGGTNFRNDKDAPGGTTYNPITGTIGRTADMSKEIQELMFKAADAIQAKKYTGAMQALGIDPLVGDAMFKISDYENLSRSEIEAKVEEYIKQQDRFKPYLEEKASYDFDDILYAKDKGAKFNQTASELLAQNMSANDNYMKYLEQKGKKNSPEYENALKNKAFLLEQMDNPNPDVIRNLFTQSEMNRQYDAGALGKIFEVNNSKTNYTFRDLPSEDDGGDGSGGVFDKNAAVVNPSLDASTYVNLENTFNKGKSTAVKAVANNNRVGGDKSFAMREISMGRKDSDLRTKMEKNPALALPRQQQILAIAQRSANATEFHRNLWNAGFKSADANNSKALWGVLSNSTNMQAISDNVKGAMNDYYNMENAMNLLEQADKNSLTDKKFLAQVGEIGSQQHVVPESVVEKFAKKVGKTVDELYRMGVVTTQTGFTKDGGETQEFLLDGNRIARTFGYKTLEEAVSKGVDFTTKGVRGLGNTLNNLQKEASKRVYSAQEMGQVFSNDKKVDNLLAPMVRNAQELASFKPLKGTWANIPGFTEEGSPMAGTNIVGAPQISVRGNQLFLRVTYDYKNVADVYGKGNLQNTVEVKIKPDQMNTVKESLNRISINAYQNKDASEASNQVYQTAVRALYIANTKAPATRQSAQTAEVSSTSREAVLETRTGSDGTRYEVVKRYAGEGVPDVYVARMVGAGGTRPIKVDGQELKSTNIEKVQSVLGELLDLRVQ